MNRENAYEFIEEADKREIMEILDAAVNRFRELFEDQELILLTLDKGESRETQLYRVQELLEKYV